MVATTVQHEERVSYCIYIAPGKEQNSEFEVRFLLNAYRFQAIEKLKGELLYVQDPL